MEGGIDLRFLANIYFTDMEDSAVSGPQLSGLSFVILGGNSRYKKTGPLNILRLLSVYLLH